MFYKAICNTIKTIWQPKGSSCKFWQNQTYLRLPDHTQQIGKINFSFFGTNWMHTESLFLLQHIYTEHCLEAILFLCVSQILPFRFPKPFSFFMDRFFFLGTMCMQTIKFYQFSSTLDTSDIRTLHFYDLSVIE